MEMNDPKGDYLESEETDFPDCVSIDYASANWCISKDKLLQSVGQGKLGLNDGEISRLDLSIYCESIDIG